ncbi:hypothetical protein Tco_1428491 [Tanacetum coccineum]
MAATIITAAPPPPRHHPQGPRKGALVVVSTQKGCVGLVSRPKGVFVSVAVTTRLKRIELMTTSKCPGVLGGDTYEGHIFITARCSWRGHLRGAHIHYCLVFLERTPARGTYSLQPDVLGGDISEGYIFNSAHLFFGGTL